MVKAPDKMRIPPEKCPHFFKIYLPQHSSEQLHIPPDFIKHFNGVVPNKTIIKCRNGTFWHVELEQDENDLFFQNGWQGFVKDQSLELGDILVFRYCGNSVFDIKIFSPTGCEKEGTSDYRNGAEKTSHIKKEEQQEASGILNESTCCFMQTYCKGSPKMIGKTNRGSTRSERNAAVKVPEDRVLSSVNPKNPHFMTTIKPHRPYELHIPQRVVRKKCLNIGPGMILRDPSGKSWPVKFISQKSGRVSLTAGWIDICRGNNLRKNDGCIFEFIQRRGRKCNVIRLHILRKGVGTSNRK